MSSWMSTVLPTPAPPKRPILPPRTYGAIRSMTLMPVSKISTFGVRSLNPGDQRAAVRARDRQRRVDVGQPAREDGVDDDALDLEQLALVSVRRHGFMAPDAMTVRVVAAAGRSERV